MQFSSYLSILAIAAISTTEAGGIGKVVKGIFGRDVDSDDVLDALILQVRDASEAEWVGKIQHWNKQPPVGMSDEVKSILVGAGCSPPSGGKAKRSLDADVSDQHLILVRQPKPVVTKKEAWAAAKQPAKLPNNIKNAFQKAGWKGTCLPGGAGAAGGKQPRGLDLGFDEDFELSARDLEEEDFYYV